MVTWLAMMMLFEAKNPVRIPGQIELSVSPPASDIPTVYPPKPSIYHADWVDLNKNGKKDIYEDPKQPVGRRVEDLLRQMTFDEKTCQLATLYGWKAVLKDQLPTAAWKSEIWKDGIANIDEHLSSNFGTKTGSSYYWPPSRHAEAINEVQRFFVEQTRLGIPVDFTNEGIHGVGSYAGTQFPIPTAMGSTWDVELVSKAGEITGFENRMLGFTNVYAPILDVVRDQRWGRSEESFSEDPFLLSRLGVALAKGIQSNGSAATAKHFAVYSFNKGAREGDSRTDPHVAPRMMEEIALKPFKDVIREADLLGVMASYNDYDGVPIAASHEFLTDRLRGQFGFHGYVVSDSDAVEYVETKHHVAGDRVHAVAQVMNAGLNVRTTFTPPQDYILPARKAVQQGLVSMSVLDQRVREVLRVKFWLGLFDRPYRSNLTAGDALVANQANQAVALRASRESLILLKNEKQLLPLNLKTLRSVAVIGPNATNTDWAHKRYGPIHAEGPDVLTALKSTFAASGIDVRYAKGCTATTTDFPNDELYERDLTPSERTGIDEAEALAKASDATILVLGDNNISSGESRSRSSINLTGRQERLARAVIATGKPVIAVVIAGRPLSINYLQDYASAIIYAFAPGLHGPQAIAETLLGTNNPSGKLPVTVPKTAGQIPLNFPYKPASNDEGLSKPAAVAGPLYPFGFGLSYSNFNYAGLSLGAKTITPGDDVSVSFEVENTSDTSGTEVAEVYFHQKVSSVTSYVKRLGGFARVQLAPHEKKRVTVTIPGRELEILDRKMKWTVEPGTFEIYVGRSSVDTPLKAAFEVK